MIPSVNKQRIEYKTRLDYTCAFYDWPCRCKHPMHKHCKMQGSPLHQSMCPEYKVTAIAELINFEVISNDRN